VRSSLARVQSPPEDTLRHLAIAVPADPNGLAYDPGSDTLYVADGGGAVLAIEHGCSRRVATIPAVGCTTDELGGIAVAPDGTLYVARLGHGHAGAVCSGITRRGAIAELPGLSPDAWRLGVVHDPAERALYTTQYDKTAAGPCDGAVVRIEPIDRRGRACGRGPGQAGRRRQARLDAGGHRRPAAGGDLRRADRRPRGRAAPSSRSAIDRTRSPRAASIRRC